jgi:hypothetical protein
VALADRDEKMITECVEREKYYFISLNWISRGSDGEKISDNPLILNPTQVFLFSFLLERAQYGRLIDTHTSDPTLVGMGTLVSLLKKI